MTLAQQNFKKAIAYRQKTGCSLKEAFAHVKGVKVAATTKKAAAKKTVTKRKKVGAYKVVEVGEKASTPPKIIQVKRNATSTFKKFETIGSINNDLKKKYTNVVELIATKKSNIAFFKEMMLNDKAKKNYYKVKLDENQNDLKKLNSIKLKLAKFK